MKIDRRKFLGLSAAGVAGAACLKFLPETVRANDRRGFMTGMLARRPEHLTGGANGTAQYLNGFVAELKWSDAQSSFNGPITTTGRNILNAAVSTAAQFNKNQIRLRVLAGAYAPNFARRNSRYGGPEILDWYETQTQNPFNIARWWRTGYMDAYEKFIEKLAPLLSDQRWKEVTISGPMTIFAEPCIRQLVGIPDTAGENRAQLESILAGYGQSTTDFNNQNRDAVLRAMDIHKNFFDNMGIVSSFAYNPWEYLTPSFGGQSDVNVTLDLMTEQRNRLANMGVWQNCSLRAWENPGTGQVEQTRATGGYPEMYDRMRDGTWYAQYQTATVARIEDASAGTPGTVYDTVRYVVQNKGLSVEMPVGWESNQRPRVAELKAQAGTLNTLMAQNEFQINYP